MMTEETLFDLALRTPEAERAALLDRACEGKPELRARVEGLLKADAVPAKLLEQPPFLDATTGFERTSSYAADDVAGIFIAGRYKLYELLTGSTPVDRKSLKQAALMEVLRIIREDEPPRPSTKLSTAQALPSIAANRHIDPAKLSKLMKGELDWIVMKALEKDRSRRFETANGFAADVMRYLSGEPVTAVPPSAGYRLKKFVKRNRGKVIAAGLVLATLVIGIIGTTVGFFHARDAAISERQAREEEAKQRQKAEAASERTRAVLDAMTSDVTGNSLITQKEISGEQRKFLNGVIDYYRQLSAEEGHDVNSRAGIAQAAERLGHIENKLGNKKEAIHAFDAAIHQYERLVAEFPTEYKLHYELGESLVNRGIVHHDMGNLKAAQADYLHSAKVFEEVIRQSPQEHRARHGCSRVYGFLAGLHEDQGDFSSVQQWYQKGQDMLEKLVQDFPKRDAYRFSLANLHHNLGVTSLNLKQDQTAEKHARLAIEMLSSLMDAQPRNAEYLNELARAHNGLGSIFLKRKTDEEAEKQFRLALGYRERLVMEFPSAVTYQCDLAEVAYNLGVVMRVTGKPMEAIEMHRKSFLTFQRLLQSYLEYPQYEYGLFMNERAIAQCYLAMKREAESVPHFQVALTSIEKTYAAKRLLAAQEVQRAGCKRELFTVLSKLGRYPEADAEMKSVIQVAEALVQGQPGNLSHLRSLSQLYFDYGMFLRDRDRKAEAEEAYLKYVRSREREVEVAGPSDLDRQVDRGGSYCNLGHLLIQHQKTKDALPWLDKAVQCLQAVVQKAPETRAAKEFLGNSYGTRSDAYGKLQQLIPAAEDAGRAMELTTGSKQDAYRLTRAFYYARAAMFADAILDIEELAKQEKFIASHWLEFATIYAKASETAPGKKLTYANRAMELLSKAVEKGYADKKKLQTDPRLRALRQREDFKEMVEKIKEKGEGKP